MSPTVLRGLAAPAVVALLTALAAFAFGAVAALGVLAAGSAAIIAFHVWNLDRLTRWAAQPQDIDAPEGRASWREPMAALYRRVRARQLHQADLAATIERFRRAAEALPDGMLIMDSGNRVQWANQRAQTHLGLDLPRDVGAALANLARQPVLVRYIDSENYSEPVVFDSQREAGATLSVQIVPFGIEEKLLISRDISRLEAVARMRRDFIANVSHELKTPLTVVTGFVETLQDLDLEPHQRRRYLQLMQEQARNMQRLVDDLLTLSALESEQNPLNETPFAIVPLLLALSADAKALSGGRHTIALDIGNAAMVAGSRDELASAFGNLISNAIRYTPDGGTITLRWRIADDGTGEFSVEDTGIGIAAEHVPRLTERFYRVDRSRSRASGGTGLGLAIVKHVLLRHQSELDVMSELARGSTFTARLPARRVQRAAEPEAAGQAAPTPTSS
jgi:two-component system, OmpR family, phosphate regulon sensor histidine kinase PhoR